MNILYVGESYVGAIAEQRRKILENLGHRIIAINNYLPLKRLNWRVLCHHIFLKLNYPLDILGVNRKMTEVCASHPLDLVWIDRGLNIYPWTIRKIRALQPRMAVVNLNPDNPFAPGVKGWNWFRKCIPLYDFCFVPREVSIKEYLQAGAQRVSRFYWGYLPDLHRPLPVTHQDRLELGGPVGFIGTHEGYRAQMVCDLARAGIPVRVWGNNWTGLKSKVPNLRVEDQPVWDTLFVRAICSFDINLGFLNKMNLDTLNTRCMAIPASGGFLLAERSGDLPHLFQEGLEAEFFGDSTELVDKTRFYLKHEALRREIAAAGRERCLNSGYSFKNRMNEILHTIGTEL